MSSLEEWTDAVCQALGIADVVDQARAPDLVLDLARDVAHGVARPAAPLTAFFVGVAAGRADDPKMALEKLSTRVRELLDDPLFKPG